ncbi:MAG: type II toxin-antitoxin system RelE/ParE family toxin [Verrucomicrobiota bacterium]|nr:type II toxin-antitoxin system RelE/ParE family toxin [Verrucomicrobiota bacterium]MDQ6939033.1 type II toxin-antitoxin system RelE/ParE family toxin [Verrucomicrobiota bacterium]
MARYVVEFRRAAEKDLRRLDPVVQRRVLRAVDNLATDPRPSGCRKLQGSDNAYRVRLGDYRIVYTVDDAVLIVAIERVRHRREVYR